MTLAEKHRHERTVRKLAHRIRDLNARLRAAEARGQNEVHRVRKGAEETLDAVRATGANMKAIDDQLHTVAESLENVGYDALVRFGQALGRGWWRRLWWGVRFGLTGRV